MKKVALLAISLSMLLSFGCASRDYVRQQIEPLVDRISKLEAENCCKKAEEAARRCERAAKKCTKSFELEQHK
jgi:hypothetical protein